MRGAGFSFLSSLLSGYLGLFWEVERDVEGVAMNERMDDGLTRFI